MSYDPDAAERVRRLLAGRGDVVEKKMVGGLSFLVNGNMYTWQTPLLQPSRRTAPTLSRQKRATGPVRKLKGPMIRL